MAKLEIHQAISKPDTLAVRALFVLYLEVLDKEYGLSGGCGQPRETIEDAQHFYAHANAHYKALFLGRLGDTKESHPVAACGLVRAGEGDLELVRLYCRPEARGYQAGRHLVEVARDYAIANGFDRLVLSTEPVMTHAVRLYRDMGFKDIENYADAPSACSKYMALVLE